MRKEGWEVALGCVIADHKDKGFKRGYNDCAIFSAKCVKALTGRDIVSRYYAQYKNKSEANSIIDAAGGYEAIITAELGAPYLSQYMAKRGDVVLIQNGDEQAIGVVDLTGKKAATIGLDGFVEMPMSSWVKGWAV